MEYLSDKLISDIEKCLNVTFLEYEKDEMRKTIRGYFIRVHNEACDSTVIASHKKTFVKPNFEDK